MGYFCIGREAIQHKALGIYRTTGEKRKKEIALTTPGKTCTYCVVLIMLYSPPQINHLLDHNLPC